MTMNSKWGWNKADKKWKSSEDLIQKLADIASKGGNFLLNIGPKPDGTFPQKAVDRLADIGKWMDLNSESIYGTKASPFDLFDWGRCTQKKLKFGKTRLYLHVFKWPASGTISIPLNNKVKVAYLLATPGEKLVTENGESKLTISLPKEAPDSADSVVVIDIKGTPIVSEVFTTQNSDGSISLDAAEAKLNAEGGDAPIMEQKSDNKSNIGGWLNKNATVEWRVDIEKPGTFAVDMEMASEKDSAIKIDVATKEGEIVAKLDVKLSKTNGYGEFKMVSCGTVKIEKPGIYKITLRPNKKSWQPINVRRVTLK